MCCWLRICLLIVLLTGLPACLGSLSYSELTSNAQLNAYTYSGEYFDLMCGQRGHAPVLHVYIEGDGKAWRNRRQPTDNPTPDDPVGLRLAAVDRHDAVLYLSRPCQFVKGTNLRNCGVPLWTSARFAEPVINDIDHILNQAKSRAGASRLVLVGYSGEAQWLYCWQLAEMMWTWC